MPGRSRTFVLLVLCLIPVAVTAQVAFSPMDASATLDVGTTTDISVTVQNTSGEALDYRLRLRTVARPPGPGRLFSKDGLTIREIDPVSGAVVRTISLPYEPEDPSYSFYPGYLAFDGASFFTTSDTREVARFDLDGQFVEWIPFEADLGFGGDELTVGGGEIFALAPPPSNDEAAVVAYDLETGTERVLTVSLEGQHSLPGPPKLAYGGRRGSLFLAAASFDDRTVVVEVDAETGEVRNRFEVPFAARAVAYSDARSVLYLQDPGPGYGTETTLIDPNTGEAVGQMNVAGEAFAADESAAPLFLRAGPESGSLAAGASAAVTLRADAAGLVQGTYEARVDAEVGGAVVASLPVTLDVIGRPRLVLGRSAIVFGDVLAGMTVHDTVRVSNGGSAALSVAVTVEGPATFSASPTELTLAPGDKAALAVVFEADALGDASAVLRLTTNDPDAPSAAIALSATVVEPPDISVLPTKVAASIDAGESTSRGLLIGNEGGLPLTYTVRAEAEDGSRPSLFSADYYVVRQIDPATFDVVGSFEASSRTTYGGGPSAIASDGTLLYYAVSGQSTVQVYDPASGVAVRSFDLPVGDVQGLAHDGTRLYASFSADSQNVVRFSPDGSAIDAQLSIPDGYLFDGDMAYGDGVLYVLARVSGEGVVLRLDAETGASLGVVELPFTSPTGIAYLDGELYVGRSASLVVLNAETGVVLRESSNVGAGVGALALVESFVDWASVSPAAGELAPSASTATTVTFDAADLVGGTYEGVLVFESNDPNEPELRVPLTLTVAGEADVAIPPDPVTFGDVYVGARVQRRIRIENEGTADLTAAISGPTGISAEPASLTLAPGASASVVVTYAPVAAGILDGSLQVASNDPDEPTAPLALSGTASAGPVAEIDAAVEGEVSVGETVTRRVTLRNTGAAPLRYTVVVRPAAAPRPELIVADRASGEAIRVDAVTGEDLGTIPLPGVTALAGLAASADSLYVLDETRSQFGNQEYSIRVYDRSTGDFVRSFWSGERQLRFLGFGDGVLYAVRTDGLYGSVTALDVATGALSAVDYDTRRGSVAAIGGVSAGAGLVYLQVRDHQNLVSGTLVVDAETSETVRFIEQERAASSVAYVDGRLFRSIGVYMDALVAPFDPTTGAPAVGPTLPMPFVAGVGPVVRWGGGGSVAGTVAPGATAEVEVPLGGETLEVGTYDAVLAVLTDDPAALETTAGFRLNVGGPDAVGPARVDEFEVGEPYPNPVRGTASVAVALPSPARVAVELFDATGRRLYRSVSDLSAGAHTLAVGREDLPAGVYVARITAGDDVASRQLAIVR